MTLVSHLINKVNNLAPLFGGRMSALDLCDTCASMRWGIRIYRLDGADPNEDYSMKVFANLSQ